ncbi:hypothetical protein I4U23_000511 [Adineta vaga]|nr:hypothetical protein I4U23_000511 [Adineta vaga]
MFSTFLLLVCCCSLSGSFAIDSTSKQKYIDGTQYTIKSVNITYNQQQCSVELRDQSKQLTEGEVIKLKNKFFKVEECRLNRAYRAPCGSRLFNQLRNLVCSTAEQNHQQHIQRRQQTNNEPNYFLNRSGYNYCCESACTIAEFVQYCSSRW